MHSNQKVKGNVIHIYIRMYRAVIIIDQLHYIVIPMCTSRKFQISDINVQIMNYANHREICIGTDFKDVRFKMLFTTKKKSNGVFPAE